MRYIKLTEEQAEFVRSLAFARLCALQPILTLEGYWVLPAEVLEDTDYEAAWAYLGTLEQTDTASFDEEEGQ